MRWRHTWSRFASLPTVSTYNSRRYALANKRDPTHLDRIDRYISIDEDHRILEVGCGQGYLTTAIADRGADVIGVDANPQAVKMSATDLVEHMRAEALDFEDETFDYVVSVHAIEHIPRLRGALTEMVRVLRARGRAVLVYPAEPIRGLFAIPSSVIVYRTPFRAREIHCQKIWPAKLRRMLAPMGMREVDSQFSFLRTPQFTSVFEKIG